MPLGIGTYVTDFFLEPDDGGPNSQIIMNTLGLSSVDKAQTYLDLAIDTNRVILIDDAACPYQYAYPFFLPVHSQNVQLEKTGQRKCAIGL